MVRLTVIYRIRAALDPVGIGSNLGWCGVNESIQVGNFGTSQCGDSQPRAAGLLRVDSYLSTRSSPRVGMQIVNPKQQNCRESIPIRWLEVAGKIRGKGGSKNKGKGVKSLAARFPGGAKPRRKFYINNFVCETYYFGVSCVEFVRRWWLLLRPLLESTRLRKRMFLGQ